MQATTDSVTCVPGPAPAPVTPPRNKSQSTGSCPPARGRGPAQTQDRIAAPHGLLRAASGPRPADDRPAAAAPHDMSPANNNRTEERRISCRQQLAPPLRYAAKMSPRISIVHRPGARPGRPCPVPTHRAATARREQVQPSILKQNFSTRPIDPLPLMMSLTPTRPSTKGLPFQLMVCAIYLEIITPHPI